ncbi:MAG: hypothetical protein H0U76_16835 [Ktedonobacteraceae bacterium]|nr:hypothetical protein [Ktedonobacteraceae bacterium]
MQDPDQTIPVPQGYNAPGQPQWSAPQSPNGQPQGQYPQQANGWPSTQQSPYPQVPGQQPFNAGPGQFSGYPQGGPGQQFPQPPQTPRSPKKRNLHLAAIGVIVLLILGVGGFFIFTHLPAQKASNQNTTAQSSSNNATAKASSSQSSSGQNASAGSSAQSSASSDGNNAQAKTTAAVATAVVSTAVAQAQSGNVPSQAQVLAQAGPPDVAAKSFFTAIQNQDYNTAYKLAHFKNFTSEGFRQTSIASDQSLGKLNSFTLGKTTLIPGSDTIKAQVAVVIARANVPSHSGLTMLVLENGTWKITDGTVWQ